MKLWQVDSGANEDSVSKLVEQYTVGDDYLLDQRLVPWDCVGSLAHAIMLSSIGILSSDELVQLKAGLSEILRKSRNGEFGIAPSDEDCHTAIENFLVMRFGDVGKKIHTARSRNDQVLTALKLFSKDSLFEIIGQVLEFAETLTTFAQDNPTAMPGYTHTQKAMPSSVALWAGAYAESMVDNIRILRAAFDYIDSSPLGSAAGYGVSFEIDRELTAKLLGFSRVQNNVLYAQTNRGKNEAAILAALNQIMLDLSKLSSDLILYSIPELGFFELPVKFCTGSSIMPQKKNPDVLELMRAKAKVVASLYQQVLSLGLDLPSGYNRDFQLTKKPLFDALDITRSSVQIMNSLFLELQVNTKNCERALSPEVFATDIAYQYVRDGLPFRDAYRQVKGEIQNLKVEDPYPFLESKMHLGAPGNLGLDLLEGLILKLQTEIEQRQLEFKQTLQSLFD